MHAKHTPGPWINMGTEICGPVNSGVIVARMPEWGVLADGLDARAANARLIAAAPDLLQALEAWKKEARNPEVGGYVTSETRQKIDAAIAKANGGQS